MRSSGRCWLEEHEGNASCELLLLFSGKTLPCAGCEALHLEIQDAEVDIHSVLGPVSFF